MGIGITQHTANQFEPKNLVYNRSYITGDTTLGATYANITGLTYTIIKESYFGINGKVTFTGAASSDDCSVIIAVNGVEVPNGKSYSSNGTTAGIGSYSIPVFVNKKLLSVGDVVTIQAKYATAGGRIDFVTDYADSYMDVLEVQSSGTPNTYPFLVNAQQYDISSYISGTNVSVVDAVGMPFKDTSGNWFVWMSIEIVLTADATSFEITLTNMKQHQTRFQSMSLVNYHKYPSSGALILQYASASTFAISGTSTSVTGGYIMQGTVALKEKPDFI